MVYITFEHVHTPNFLFVCHTMRENGYKITVVTQPSFSLSLSFFLSVPYFISLISILSFIITSLNTFGASSEVIG